MARKNGKRGKIRKVPSRTLEKGRKIKNKGNINKIKQKYNIVKRKKSVWGDQETFLRVLSTGICQVEGGL